jgi:hypothetical protein
VALGDGERLERLDLPDGVHVAPGQARGHLRVGHLEELDRVRVAARLLDEGADGHHPDVLQVVHRDRGALEIRDVRDVRVRGHHERVVLRPDVVAREDLHVQALLGRQDDRRVVRVRQVVLAGDERRDRLRAAGGLLEVDVEALLLEVPGLLREHRRGGVHEREVPGGDLGEAVLAGAGLAGGARVVVARSAAGGQGEDDGEGETPAEGGARGASGHRCLLGVGRRDGAADGDARDVRWVGRAVGVPASRERRRASSTGRVCARARTRRGGRRRRTGWCSRVRAFRRA